MRKMGFLQLLKMVEDGRIFCSCDTRKSFTSVSLPEFRQHCGCVDGHMENSIYFENNKTMSEGMEAMNGDSMDLIKLSLQEVVGPCLEKRTYTCRDCGDSMIVAHLEITVDMVYTILKVKFYMSMKDLVCHHLPLNPSRDALLSLPEELGSCSTSRQILTSDSKITIVDLHVSLGKQCVQRQNCTLSNDISNRTPQVKDVEMSEVSQEESEACPGPECPNSCNKLDEHWEAKEEDKSSLKGEAYVTKNRAKMGICSTRGKKMKAETGKKNFDWNCLRRAAFDNCSKKERSHQERDSVDWDAVRCADIEDITMPLEKREMHNVLVERIKLSSYDHGITLLLQEIYILLTTCLGRLHLVKHDEVCQVTLKVDLVFCMLHSRLRARLLWKSTW